MLDRLSLILIIVGALNWGGIGLFKFDIVKNKYLASIEEKFCQLLGFDVKVNLTFTGSAAAGDSIKSKVIGLEPTSKKEEVKSPLNTLTDYNLTR